ncbi:MAG: helix-turn-helix transcriptional regulator [Kangiellaceae bacterium]|nr:helix-turn-helix transcriptional regulator [Kangiellaceae bacterium]
MQFSFFDVLLLIGITQGLVAVPLLLFAKKKRTSNLFLALAILSFCMLFIKIVMNYNGLAGRAGFRYLPNAFELTTAPLFYFYLLALTENGFRWKNKLLIHFIPFAIAQGYALYLYFHVYDLPTSDLQDQAARLFHYAPVKEVENWLIVISILGYLFAGYRKFVQFQQRVKNNTADSAYPTLRWLKSIIILSAILISFLIINMLVDRFWYIESHTEAHWKTYFIYQAAVTYYLSFMAYRQPKIDLKQIYPPESLENAQETFSESHGTVVNQLEQVLQEQKLYLDPSLNVSRLAQELDISPTNLSLIINSHYKQSFRSLINDYRLKDIKAKLLDPNNKASILSLALESGFNSEASFYRVFKATTGLTPRAFIEQHSAKD